MRRWGWDGTGGRLCHMLIQVVGSLVWAISTAFLTLIDMPMQVVDSPV